MQVKGSNGRFYTYLAEFRIISDSLLALADQKRTRSHQLRESERPAFLQGIRLAVGHFEDLVKADKELVSAHKEILLFYIQSFSQWLIGSFQVVKTEETYTYWRTTGNKANGYAPDSKKLIERFKDNDGIVFLFVSFDKDVEKWKGFLAKKDRLNGLHVIIDRNEPSVAELYRITGIPHCLLIDDQGKIESANAMRPSIPETVDLLDELLALRERRFN